MHVIVWQFTTDDAHRDAFKAAYGPEGVWAVLFRKGQGYLGTELLADREDPNRFLVIDRWRAEADFHAFKAACGAAYAALDRHCAALTTTETFIGQYHAGEDG